ncbi:MAG TPA: type VI secretion protein IcmF/TssM N-terminal domain-containing protein, partial [Polyangiaceae bacterium]
LDLIPGFIEYWGDLTKPQRAQAWGATFGLDDPRVHDTPRAVEAEFDLLADVLHARMIERIARETVQEVRTRILQFPIAFDALRPHVSHFIDALFQVDPYRDSPLLRGFYFSSGTQTGASMDRVLANMSKGFDLRPNVGAPVNRPGESHSYFVTELFEKVIFPDRHLAMLSTTRARRQTLQQILMGGAALLITTIAVLPAMVSFARSRALITESVADVGQARALEGSSSSTADAADVLLGRVRELEKQESELRIPGFWGPRSAPALRSAVHDVYLQRLRAIVSGPVREDLTANVRNIGTLVRVDAENFKSAYEDLKLYLMLVQPEHLNLDWAAPHLTQAWLSAMGGEGRSSREKIEDHSRRYLQALAADPSWAWPADATVIARARGRLVSQPLDELRYGWLVEKTKEVPSIKPSKIFFGASAQYFSARDNVEVRGLYTAPGWEIVRRALESSDAEFDFEPWVLGQDLARVNDGGTGTKRLRELYFERYVRAWSDFMGALSVAASPDI